jgi:enterochelin esterase-like enzyme
MNRLLLIICILTSFQFSGIAQTHFKITIGKTLQLHSEILNENRDLNIYVTEYFDSTKSSAVLYLLDGSLNEAFMHVAGLIQFFDMTFQIPQTIVVGIANVDRKRDFTFATTAEELKKEFVPSLNFSYLWSKDISTRLILPFLTFFITLAIGIRAKHIRRRHSSERHSCLAH